MSKRARVWGGDSDESKEDHDDPVCVYWPHAKAQKIERVAPTDPGTLANILPEVRTLIWRTLEYEHATRLAWTCRWMYTEMIPFLVPPHLRGIMPGKLNTGLRIIFLDLVRVMTSFFGLVPVDWFINHHHSSMRRSTWVLTWRTASHTMLVSHYRTRMHARAYRRHPYVRCPIQEAVDCIRLAHETRKKAAEERNQRTIPSFFRLVRE